MKYIALSVIVVGLVSSLNAAEDLSSMFTEGKTSGQIREFSISRSIDVSVGTDYTRSANVIGGYLKFETADFKGLGFGAAFYTTNGFSNNNDKTSSHFDPTLLGKDNKSYSMVGEAYLQYKNGNTTFKAGRQKLDTPMAGSDDARMLPNLFEAYVLSNTDIADTTLIAAHVTGFAQGTFGRAYDASANAANSLLSVTAGYSAVDSRNQVGEFNNMGTYAVGQSTAGVSAAAVVYSGVKNLKLQLWDYYAHDILNIVYGQADYSWNCLLSDSVHPFAAAQFIKENDVGKKYAGNLEGTYWGAKFGAKVENFTAYVAYSQTDANDAGQAATENAIITAWGGMPAFTQGMVTRHMFMAGTKATKVAASYNFKAFGPDLTTALYYVKFDMAVNNGYTFGDAKESGFDITYKPEMVKNLNLRLRGNFADDFNVAQAGITTSWDEYRVIINYNF
jgi:imipenem/basic amino acid-specific outer membrane pore